MKKKLVFLLISGIIIGAGIFIGYQEMNNSRLISPLGKTISQTTEKPLDKYTHVNLKKRKYTGSDITSVKKIKDVSQYSSYTYFFLSDGKKVSGMANIPKSPGSHPIIVMFRGYIDPKVYTTGQGTQHAAELFAANGFITLAPDFLGYGTSDNPSSDVMEERFTTYTTGLNLLSSISRLNTALQKLDPDLIADTDHIGIWGHSNGGQIAISILEISGVSYPTVLWAPVSKPFPYSILYYTDDIEDHGKGLRKVVANFEKDYDSEKYSLTNYLDWILSPIQLHQGQNDQSVPQVWSEQLVENLKKLNKDVSYFTYPGEDHNFSGTNDWNTIVQRNIAFYQSHFTK